MEAVSFLLYGVIPQNFLSRHKAGKKIYAESDLVNPDTTKSDSGSPRPQIVLQQKPCRSNLSICRRGDPE